MEACAAVRRKGFVSKGILVVPKENIFSEEVGGKERECNVLNESKCVKGKIGREK